MNQLPRLIKYVGFPTAILMTIWMLLLSTPLHSEIPPKNIAQVHFAHGDFVSVHAFANLFGVIPHATPANHKLSLSISGRPVVFTRLSSVVKIDQELYRMPQALFAYQGQLYMPAQTAAHLAQHFHTTLAFQTPVPSDIPATNTPHVFSNATPQQPKIDVAQNAANWTLKTVVIDPGHGGKDPGAIGHSGTHEKEIVLGVAMRLKKLLEKELNVHVILTRDNDTFIPLKTRSKIAIQKGGKVFISLHCNATSNHKAEGVEVYFLSEAKTKDAADVAKAENAVLEKYEGVSVDSLSDEIDRIKFGLLSSQFLKESQDLASDLHNAIIKKIPDTTPRGVKQANFFVMRGTMGQMPSVLVELGFVTNRTEEKRLKSNTHQQKIAEALLNGIKTFKKRYEQQLTADSS